MTSRDFCYWLQGFFELHDKSELVKTEFNFSHQQTDAIKAHLKMVFHHEIDPGFGKDKPALDKIHQGLPPSLEGLKFSDWPPGPKINC